MKAEILHIDDCPSWEEAGRLLREALDSTGHQDTVITYTLVISAAAAAQVPVPEGSSEEGSRVEPASV